MWEEILHALIHSVQILPFLFLAYLLIELVEEKIVDKYKTKKVLTSPFAPVISAGFGLIPQCGFSVVATDLFSHKFLSIGSLLAVYIATIRPRSTYLSGCESKIGIASSLVAI